MPYGHVATLSMTKYGSKGAQVYLFFSSDFSLLLCWDQRAMESIPLLECYLKGNQSSLRKQENTLSATSHSTGLCVPSKVQIIFKKRQEFKESKNNKNNQENIGHTLVRWVCGLLSVPVKQVGKRDGEK